MFLVHSRIMDSVSTSTVLACVFLFDNCLHWCWVILMTNQWLLILIILMLVIVVLCVFLFFFSWCCKVIYLSWFFLWGGCSYPYFVEVFLSEFSVGLDLCIDFFYIWFCLGISFFPPCIVIESFAGYSSLGWLCALYRLQDICPSPSRF